MTRINIIPVEELTDNFLRAEYFELPRLWPLIKKAIDKNDRDIPETYRLGTGHVRFFYNKINYLVKRREQLFQEGTKRNIDLLEDIVPIDYEDFTIQNSVPFWWNDYEPTEEALAINRERLLDRTRFKGGVYG